MQTLNGEASGLVPEVVHGEDPTMNELEAAAADRVGMAEAVYVPTGTMGNQIAARVHTDRGQEAVLDREAHVYRWELAGLAQLSDAQPRTVDAGGDVPTLEQIREACVAGSVHRPGAGFVTLENTHNSWGGGAVPAASISAAADAAHDLDVPVHLDGARLFNACVALDTDPRRVVRDVDSVLCCLSKGLGAPAGSILAGDAEFVDAARRIRKLFDGGMRQVGLLALESTDRLATDHDNAARLAAGLDAIDGLRVPEPETNIVQVHTDGLGIDAETFVDACEAAGVRGGAHDPTLVRFCTHRDIDRDDIDPAVDRVADAVTSGWYCRLQLPGWFPLRGVETLTRR